MINPKENVFGGRDKPAQADNKEEEMKSNLTEIICVVDKSGSMSPRTADVIGGFNQFLEDQKKVAGEALITLTLFDTSYTVVHNGKALGTVPPLNNNTYIAGGMTALLDAIGKTIDEVGARLHKTPESDRPEKVIFLIITDGEENSSKEYRLEQIKEKIKIQQESFKWAFVYLGANQDAFLGATTLNIPGSNSKLVDLISPNGVHMAYRGAGMTVSCYRNTGKVDLNN
jgi:uncharacterized protein YegL